MAFSFNALMRRQFILGTIAAAGGLLAGSRVGHAASMQEGDAKAVVNGLVGHILHAIAADAQGPAQVRRLMAAIENQTDLGLLARMTMGRHWRRASHQQRAIYVEIFGQYLLSSFATRLRRYAGTDPKAAQDRFSITSTRGVGKNDMLVRSRVVPFSGAPLEVDWRLRPKNGRFVIIDLVVEGVSLLITQRSEFGAVLERIGIDGLINELQSRVARQS